MIRLIFIREPPDPASEGMTVMFGSFCEDGRIVGHGFNAFESFNIGTLGQITGDPHEVTTSAIG